MTRSNQCPDRRNAGAHAVVREEERHESEPALVTTAIQTP